MALTPATGRQIPNESILDAFCKQTYLGNAYIVPTTVALSNTAETPIILIENPATQNFPNGQALFINLRRFTSDLQEVLINSYIAPVTTSVSTATVPSNLRPASPNTSISKVYQNGQFSLSSNGTLISSIGCASNNYVVQDNQLLVILDPGQKLLITATAITGGTNISADVSWYEL